MYNSNSHPLAIRGNAAGFSSLYEALSTIHVLPVVVQLKTCELLSAIA